jgi:hypothetical protein
VECRRESSCCNLKFQYTCRQASGISRHETYKAYELPRAVTGVYQNRNLESRCKLRWQRKGSRHRIANMLSQFANYAFIKSRGSQLCRSTSLSTALITVMSMASEAPPIPSQRVVEALAAKLRRRSLCSPARPVRFT